MDAVGTRDYAMEFLAAGAILGVHLSRLAEDLVLWSSAEFGFVRLGDAWSTGSSLMPQKRNPDGCELIRGKAGRLIGNLVALLTVGKGLASGYQRDLQEDKEPCFDTLDTLRLALPVAEGTVGTMEISEDRMRAALSWDLLATDLAEYLVAKGLPFRDAHRVAGEVFAHCERESVEPPDLDLATLRGFSPAFDEDVNGGLGLPRLRGPPQRPRRPRRHPVTTPSRQTDPVGIAGPHPGTTARRPGTPASGRHPLGAAQRNAQV